MLVGFVPQRAAQQGARLCKKSGKKEVVAARGPKIFEIKGDVNQAEVPFFDRIGGKTSRF